MHSLPNLTYIPPPHAVALLPSAAARYFSSPVGVRTHASVRSVHGQVMWWSLLYPPGDSFPVPPFTSVAVKLIRESRESSMSEKSGIMRE